MSAENDFVIMDAQNNPVGRVTLTEFAREAIERGWDVVAITPVVKIVSSDTRPSLRGFNLVPIPAQPAKWPRTDPWLGMEADSERNE